MNVFCELVIYKLLFFFFYLRKKKKMRPSHIVIFLIRTASAVFTFYAKRSRFIRKEEMIRHLLPLEGLRLRFDSYSAFYYTHEVIISTILCKGLRPPCIYSNFQVFFFCFFFFFFFKPLFDHYAFPKPLLTPTRI